MPNINHFLKICVASINVEMDPFLCCYFVSTANQQAVNTNEALLLTRSMKINQQTDLTTKQHKKFSALSTLTIITLQFLHQWSVSTGLFHQGTY